MLQGLGDHGYWRTQVSQDTANVCKALGIQQVFGKCKSAGSLLVWIHPWCPTQKSAHGAGPLPAQCNQQTLPQVAILEQLCKHRSHWGVCNLEDSAHFSSNSRNTKSTPGGGHGFPSTVCFLTHPSWSPHITCKEAEAERLNDVLGSQCCQSKG